jgi:hypothetical protein
MAGTTAARAVLAQNTIVQRGRATTTGDASALFVVAADDLELQDNLVAYTGADAAGVSIAINDTGRIGRLLSDTNWSAANERPVAAPPAWPPTSPVSRDRRPGRSTSARTTRCR